MSEGIRGDRASKGSRLPIFGRVADWLEDAGVVRSFGRQTRELSRTGPHRGSVAVVSRAGLGDCDRWLTAFESQRKDRRYYELVEDTLRQDFDFRYFVVKNEIGQISAIQPFFLHDQDLLAGTGRRIQAVTAFIRRLWPHFLRMRTLMVGCAAGEGHIDDGDGFSGRVIAQLLPSAAIDHARALKVPMVVLKEFPARYRDTLECFRRDDYTCMPSLPMTRLRIDYANFEDYMTRALSRATRKNFRRKFKAAAQGPAIEMTVVTDLSPIIDEVYPLYLQVYERSNLHFEKLTPEYLCELGRRMPDKVRFFVWRRAGRIIAFSVCMVHGDTIYDEYIGLDYTVALDLHLYHYTIRDIMNWAITQGYLWYCSSSLNYDPKLHLRCQLEPLDLYIRHTSPLVNAALKLALPLLAPTRSDKTLERFPNYADLWVNP